MLHTGVRQLRVNKAEGAAKLVFRPVLACAQCEGVVATLEAAQRPGARVAETATPTAKLHAAALQDNDRFLASEGDQQQLLLRCVVSLRCMAASW